MRGGNGAGDLRNHLPHGVDFLIAQHAHRRTQSRALRDGVIRAVASPQVGHGNHDGLQRIKTAGQRGLQRHLNLRQRRHRVDGIVRAGAVPALAQHSNGQVGGAGHHRAWHIVEGAAVLRADVQAVGSNGASASGVEHALLNHRQRAARAFLAGLEHKGDIAVQLLAVLAQNPRRAHQTSGVQIVAAGVHIPIRRRERATGLLAHLQGVHVRAQKHRHRPLAALAAAQHGHHRAQILAHVNLQRQALQRF